MLRKLSLLTFLFVFAAGLSAAGIEFFHGTWEEALAKAEAEDKLIFVDAYTTWCGPCKRMAKNVFPLTEVGEVYNASFINVKLDMEKEESVSFRKKHPVRAYPTLFWINGKNEEVHKSVGGKQAQSLIAAANMAIAKMDDLPALTAEYEAGERDPKFVFRYVRALVRNQENHAKVANDFLRENKDRKDPNVLNLIQVAATTADSRIFDMLTKNRAAIVALNGQEAYDASVRAAVKATKDRAVEYRDKQLLGVAVAKLKPIDAAAAKQLSYAGAYEMAARGGDLKAFTKAMKNYLKKGANGETAALQSIYTTAVKTDFINDDKVLSMAVEAAASAAAADQATGFTQYYRLADFLLKRGKTELALKYARIAKDDFPEQPANYQRAIDGLLKRIEEAR